MTESGVGNRQNFSNCLWRQPASIFACDIAKKLVEWTYLMSMSGERFILGATARDDSVVHEYIGSLIQHALMVIYQHEKPMYVDREFGLL